MAALADAKRHQYRDHARPFQIPASNARELHEAFLPKLLEWEPFTVLVHQSEGEIDAFIVGRFGGAPPPFGAGALFHVDDFAVAAPGLWHSTGAVLLRELAKRAAAADLDRAIVVSGPASVDPDKVRFLRRAGLAVAAEWRVKPLTPRLDDEVPEQQGFEAIVGPAPPVYDPGGATCLAVRVDDPTGLANLERFASAAGAVVVIVPVRNEEVVLRDALDAANYVVASEWYAADTVALT